MLQCAGKVLNHFSCASCKVRRVFNRVEGNQVDVDVQSHDPRGQFLSLINRIVVILQHQVLDHQRNVLQSIDFRNGPFQILKRILHCQWYDGFANFRIHTVEAERQVDPRKPIRAAHDGFRNADRRNQQAGRRSVKLANISQDLQDLMQILLSMKRFAHPHKDNISQTLLFAGEHLPGLQHLVKHLSGG